MKFKHLALSFFFLLYSELSAQNPLLFIPSFSTEVTPVEEKIFLPAYNTDIIKNWPSDLLEYNSVISENEGSMISLKVKSKTVNTTISNALSKKYITIFAITETVYGRSRGLIVEPAENNKLLSMNCTGLVIGSQNQVQNEVSIPILNKILERRYELNAMYLPTYLQNQQKIWESLFGNKLIDSNYISELQKGIYQNILIGSKRLPPYYSLEYNNGIIGIKTEREKFNAKNPSANQYNEDGQLYLQLQEIINMLKPLISDLPTNDTKINLSFSSEKQLLESITIDGKFKGIIPVKIIFTTTQPVKMVALFSEKQLLLSPESTYDVDIFIVYEDSENNEVCPLKFPSKINYSPLIDEQINLTGCDTKIRFNSAKIAIEL